MEKREERGRETSHGGDAIGVLHTGLILRGAALVPKLQLQPGCNRPRSKKREFSSSRSLANAFFVFARLLPFRPFTSAGVSSERIYQLTTLRLCGSKLLMPKPLVSAAPQATEGNGRQARRCTLLLQMGDGADGAALGPLVFRVRSARSPMQRQRRQIVSGHGRPTGKTHDTRKAAPPPRLISPRP
ncbi:uncharacterized protein VTP21DRAFT_4040 [Calcarisporiella thermophila]|uniref:uncharacterized protein n=1 Tax=Calcarisporiella thermophila TaxID=911321 RepID=UPI0037421FEF